MQALHHLSIAEQAANRTFVLATYRHLLRATRIAFRGIFRPPCSLRRALALALPF